MSPTANRSLKPVQGEHPYIVQTAGVCGGRPRILDSRISVRTIAELYRRGEPVSEIRETYPHLPSLAIDDAIGYYLDHQAEIEAEFTDNSLEAVLADTGAVLGDDGVIRFPKKP
jgi:uncharacterized protein (DUF433 family)